MRYTETFKRISILRELAIRLRFIVNRCIPVMGKGNIIKKEGVVIHSKIRVRGDNNRIFCHKHSTLLNVKIEINGNNHLVNIAPGAYLSGTHIVLEDNGCILTIGDNTFIGPSHLALTEDGSSLTIGRDCMISSNVQIRTGDSHAIYNSEGHRINYAENVNIGDMVWLGEGARVLKGVILKDNIIVSTGAVVTKSFDENVLIGGVPAKILKNNVNWSHSRY